MESFPPISHIKEHKGNGNIWTCGGRVRSFFPSTSHFSLPALSTCHGIGASSVHTAEFIYQLQPRKHIWVCDPPIWFSGLTSHSLAVTLKELLEKKKRATWYSKVTINGCSSPYGCNKPHWRPPPGMVAPGSWTSQGLAESSKCKCKCTNLHCETALWLSLGFRRRHLQWSPLIICESRVYLGSRGRHISPSNEIIDKDYF